MGTAVVQRMYIKFLSNSYCVDVHKNETIVIEKEYKKLGIAQLTGD